MRKLLAVTLLVAMTICLTAPAVQAAALPPASCVFAEELGWNSPGWNRMCIMHLQMNCCDPLGDPWYD